VCVLRVSPNPFARCFRPLMVRKLTFQSLCRIFSNQTVPKGKLQPWCRLFMTANGGWIMFVTGNFCSKHKTRDSTKHKTRDSTKHKTRDSTKHKTRDSTKHQGLACDHGKQHFIMKWVCDFEGRTSSKKHSYIFCSHRKEHTVS